MMPRSSTVVTLLSLLIVSLTACGVPEHVPASPAVTAPQAEPDSIGLTSCSGAAISRDQLAGEWVAGQNNSIRYSLSVVGSLTITNPDGTTRLGRWQFVPWKMTPAMGGIPAPAPSTCVLWLDEDGPGDPAAPLLFVPLKLSYRSVDLAVVGRGDTVTWYRAAARP